MAETLQVKYAEEMMKEEGEKETRDFQKELK